MLKIHPSIRQWVLSFLAVDLIFWLLVGFGCATDPVSCLETWSFGSFFFYFPMIFLPMPFISAGGIALSTFLIPICGIVSHVLLGALVGWVLRKTKIAQFVSFAVALVVLFGGTYGTVYYNFKAEMARESRTDDIPTTQEITWSDWEEYADPQGLFSFRRSPYMTTTSAQEPFGHLANVGVAYSTDRAGYHPDNYSENSWFVVSSQVLDEASCYASINGEQLTFSDVRMIGATTFKVAAATTAGAGNSYEQTLYRTHIDGICFEIATTLHYASDYNDIDEELMSASQAEARTMLDEMVSTFRFNLDNSQGL